MQLPLVNLFAKSPFPGVAELMRLVVDCVEAVPPMIDALIDGDQEQVTAHAKRVSSLEGKADQAKRAIRGHMPIRLLLPVARRDVLRMVRQIDSIADSAEDLAVLLTLRPMEVPASFRGPLRELTEHVVRCVNTADRLVGELDILLANGFGGHAAERVLAMVADLSAQEHKADKVQDALAKRVFDMESELSPVAVMMWMKIFEEMGEIANHAENVGEQFRLFTAN